MQRPSNTQKLEFWPGHLTAIKSYQGSMKSYCREHERGTMARWMIKSAEALLPILNVLSERLHESFYVAYDETKVQVLKENGRKAQTDTWMWVSSTPFGENKIVLFDYDVSRNSEAAKNLFVDYKGYLQCCLPGVLLTKEKRMECYTKDCSHFWA